MVADGIIFLGIFADGAAQFDRAEVRGVVRLALFERVNAGLADVPRRVKIRLADAERNHVLHLGDDFKKVADARLGQVDDVSGDVARGVHFGKFQI
jgi:galactose-1-phosphate uridylyltransferase